MQDKCISCGSYKCHKGGCYLLRLNDLVWGVEQVITTLPFFSLWLLWRWKNDLFRLDGINVTTCSYVLLLLMRYAHTMTSSYSYHFSTSIIFTCSFESLDRR